MLQSLIIIGTVLMCQITYTAHIAVIGCGYVGLTCAAVLAHANNSVICIDTNLDKIRLLQTQQLPFYEPGLTELLFHPQHHAKVTFSTKLTDTLPANIYYICVPTPLASDGSCDRSYLHQAYDTLLEILPQHSTATICVKSTVPPGTMQSLITRTSSAQHPSISLIYNPEFMREGSALHDMQTRNPIILGGQSENAIDSIKQLLTATLPNVQNTITTNFQTAELIKYAWNSFSALRITYINELADLCRTIGADISSVTQALAHSEQLLPTQDLKPGPGYGGSCLPKDTRAFAHALSNAGFATTLVHQTIESNEAHKQRILSEISHLINTTRSRATVTLLGLSFKPNTDDVRNSIALELIPLLMHHGVHIQAYDPKAMPHMSALFPTVHYCDNAYGAIQDSDMIIVVTEWEEFKQLDLAQVATLCKTRYIIDTRNIYAPSKLKAHNFEYLTMGSL